MHLLEHGAYPMTVAPGEIPELVTHLWPEQLWRLNWWYVQINTQLQGEGKSSPYDLFHPDYIFRCPSDLSRKSASREWHLPTYGYNQWGLQDLGYGSEPGSEPVVLGLGGVTEPESNLAVPTPESHVKAPGAMIAIADNFLGTSNWRLMVVNGGIQRDVPFPAPPDLPDFDTPLVRQRHRGRVNLLFCDGHVEGARLEQTFFDRTDIALRRWNKDHEPHPERLPQ
jgi:prepilin-type processing-associated H-X9-DG protein